jgi:hypothetical protein
VRDGRQWAVSWRGRRAVVRDIVGIRYLAVLSQRGSGGVPAVELAGGESSAGAEYARVSVRKALLRAVREVEGADPTIGAQVRRQLRTGHVCVLDPLTPT